MGEALEFVLEEDAFVVLFFELVEELGVVLGEGGGLTGVGGEDEVVEVDELVGDELREVG